VQALDAHGARLDANEAGAFQQLHDLGGVEVTVPMHRHSSSCSTGWLDHGDSGSPAEANELFHALVTPVLEGA
jgi:hypothetical protein